ncbi:MAG: methyltransferase domain-containing protein [Candidatus Paceibacterota bacterium]|jgi:ubiquinone/menaquinone biosynthesis C-methylase UbiE
MAFADPLANLQQVNLTPGMTVVDFGAGSGAYTIPAARLVAPEGRVYAVEIQKDLLETIKKAAEAEHLGGNVNLIWGDVEQQGGVGLADNLADIVIISNVLFQARSMYTLALEAKRILKQGGRIMVIDWEGSFDNLGPKAEDIISADEVKKTFGSTGLTFLSDFPAGEHHYGLIFSK